MPRLAHEEVVDLQNRLILRYARADFQERMRAAFQDAGDDLGQKMRARQELALEVQSQILPTFGFDDSARGVLQSAKALDEYRDDAAVQLKSDLMDRLTNPDRQGDEPPTVRLELEWYGREVKMRGWDAVLRDVAAVGDVQGLQYLDKEFPFGPGQLHTARHLSTKKSTAHFLAEGRHLAALRHLRRLRVPLDLGDVHGKTPAHYAAERGALGVLQTLKDLGALIDARDSARCTPAHGAAAIGMAGAFPGFRELGMALDARNIRGQTPAHLAAEHGQASSLRALRDLDVPLDVRDESGKTPAHAAAGRGHLEVLSTLHELGVPLDAGDEHGSSPAHDAAERGQAAALRALRELGVSLDRGRDDGKSPMDLVAASPQREDVLRILEGDTGEEGRTDAGAEGGA